MATRMQQRRGTAAQWISTNSGNGPILNAGEIGWESDTNKFKMGDGTNTWLALDYFADINSTVNPAFGSSITFEGATANDYETTLAVTDPTADRTITLPNVTGTVITTGNLSDITNIGVFTSTIVMEGSTADAYELTLSAGDPTANRTITFPDATGTVALLDNISTSLGDYILTSLLGENNGPAELNGSGNLLVPSASIILEGTGADDANETTLTVTNPTAARTITFQDATGTVVLRDSTDTLTNKSISLGSNTVTSTLAQLNTAVTDADVASLAGSETLTNKTLTSPIIATILNGAATLTMPTATGTVALTSDISAATGGSVNETGTQTLTNKTIAFASNTLTGVAPLASPALTGTATAVNLTLSGDLTVNGTTTTINSTTLVVDDKNITLGDVATPSDVTADGGGITLKGLTDKTFNWLDATDAWTSSEHINLASGKALYLNGTLLKDATETLTNKTLTSPVLTTPTLSTIDAAGDLLVGTADNTLGKISIGTSGYVLTSNGTTAAWAAAAASGTDEQLVVMQAL